MNERYPGESRGTALVREGNPRRPSLFFIPLIFLVMQALRLARPRALLRTANIAGVHSIAATANPAHAAPAATTSASAVIPLSNVEAQWENLSQQEQLTVHQQLEELQKRDWKTLSLDEKKAGASRLHCAS